MIVKPRVRGFMCVTSHPAGCEKNVADQIEFIKSNLIMKNFKPTRFFKEVKQEGNMHV